MVGVMGISGGVALVLGFGGLPSSACEVMSASHSSRADV